VLSGHYMTLETSLAEPELSLRIQHPYSFRRPPSGRTTPRPVLTDGVYYAALFNQGLKRTNTRPCGSAPQLSTSFSQSRSFSISPILCR